MRACRRFLRDVAIDLATTASKAMTKDPFNLERFVEAQEGTYAGALAEIRRGAKRGH